MYLSTPQNAVAYEPFVRNTGSLQTVARDFRVNAPAPGYRLRVANGFDGGARVSSATIYLNGIQVVGPNQFGQQVATITVPVTVQVMNTLEVRLAGQPGGKIAVVVLAPQ